MPDGPRHAPHLMVLALVYRKFNPAVAADAAEQLHLRLGRFISVIQHNAVFQPPQIGRGQRPFQNSPVYLGNPVLGMRQAKGQVSVVRQQQQTRCLIVEPSDRIQPDPRQIHQLADVRPPELIPAGRYIAGRFIQRYGNRFRQRLNPFAAQANLIPLRVDLYAHFRHGLSVHRHPSCGNPFFTLAPGTDAAVGHKLLQAFHT